MSLFPERLTRYSKEFTFALYHLKSVVHITEELLTNSTFRQLSFVGGH